MSANVSQLLYLATCEVCTRTIKSALRTPILGTLTWRADPHALPATYAVCIDCAQDLLNWIALRRDYGAVGEYRVP